MTQTEQIIKSGGSMIGQLNTLHYSIAALALVGITCTIVLLSRNKDKKEKISVKLVDKRYQTHDTVVFTFLLPKNRKHLGLKIGQHIQIQALVDGVDVRRKYTPISRIDRAETFELLIKIYHKCQKFPQGGIMSQYLESLNINDNITISLPYGRFNYIKDKQVKITSLDKKVYKRKFKNIFMVAGGTGITPIYQVVQYISENQKEESAPNLTVLFANRTQDDILLKDQLLEYQKKNNNFQVYFSVDKSIKECWEGFEGFINEEKIDISLGAFKSQIEETLFLSCGPPILSNIVEKIWYKKYNVKPENMHRF